MLTHCNLWLIFVLRLMITRVVLSGLQNSEMMVSGSFWHIYFWIDNWWEFNACIAHLIINKNNMVLLTSRLCTIEEKMMKMMILILHTELNKSNIRTNNMIVLWWVRSLLSYRKIWSMVLNWMISKLQIWLVHLFLNQRQRVCFPVMVLNMVMYNRHSFVNQLHWLNVFQTTCVIRHIDS